MIAMISDNDLFKLCRFCSSGITSDAESSRVNVKVENGYMVMTIFGSTMYSCRMQCRDLKPGECWVNSKVFCEIVSKIKCKGAMINLGIYKEGNLSVRGSGFEYTLPTLYLLPSWESLKSCQCRFDIFAKDLLIVANNMKVIREAESDSDLPVCEMILSDSELQFVSITRLRSMSTTIMVSGYNGENFACVAVDHLQKMDKSLKQLISDNSNAIVSVKIYDSQVSFGFDCGEVVLRRVVSKKSKIHELIKYARDQKNIRAKITINGKRLKEAYDRLDAFGKRDQSSIHRIYFNLVNGSLSMRAYSQGVGSGSEIVDVSVIGPDPGKPIIFAAAGNKLADLLRVGGYGHSVMSVLDKSVVLEWSEVGVENLAILAGLSTGDEAANAR